MVTELQRQKWREANRRYRARNPLVDTARNIIYVLRAQALFGGCCTVCGENDPRLLEFDHKNNDGAQHRKEIASGGRGFSLVNWILNNPVQAKDKLDLLCANCHAKRHSIFNRLDGYYEIIKRRR